MVTIRVYVHEKNFNIKEVSRADFTMTRSVDNKVAVTKSRWDCYDHGQIIDIDFDALKYNEDVIKDHITGTIPRLNGTATEVEITYAI